MIIKKLELQGFKSFAERTKIIFHPGITAIIGPNGTGKSNIVDALLWVLGGQRQKAIRVDKTEDVIFSGTQKRPALGMADVVLGLEHDQEEIVINHRIFRSGESEYKLNGKPCRLKDIHDAMWKRAVSEKEYFVIEQGAVGNVLTSKPAEKRQLLEEAAGTAFYKDKKKQAQSKLESSEQNLTRLEDIIAEVSKAKNSLQRQAAAATRYRKLRERRRELMALHFHRKILNLEKKQSEAIALYEACLSQEREIVVRIKNDERDLTQKRTDLWELEKSLKESEERLRAVESHIHRLEADRDTKRLDVLEEKRRNARASLEELDRELMTLVLEIARTTEEIEGLGAALEAKRRETAETESRIRTLEEAEAAWKQNLQNIKNRHLEKVSELTGLRNDCGRTEKELEMLLRQEEKLRAQIEREESALAEYGISLGRVREILQEHALTREEKSRRIGELTRSAENALRSIDEIEAQLAGIKEKRDLDFYELQALKKMDQKERETAPFEPIPGSLGILADLVEAEPEYAALLDVFWKEEARAGAVRAEDFLKSFPGGELKSQVLLLAGRETHGLPAQLVQDPDVLGFLKAHIRPDDRIRDFLPQLEEAAVVRDVLTAVRFWLRCPGVNVITLSGDLLLSSGLLKPGRKGEGIFAIAAEIKILEERIGRHDAGMKPVAEDLERNKSIRKDIEETLRSETSGLAVIDKKIQEEEQNKALADAGRNKALTSLDVFRKELEILLAEKEELVRTSQSFAQRIASLDAEEKGLKSLVETEEARFSSEREKLVQEGKAGVELRAEGGLLEEKIRNIETRHQALIQRKNAAAARNQALRDDLLKFENEEATLQETIRDLEIKVKELEEDRQLRFGEIREKEAARQDLHAEEVEREKALNQLREDAETKKEDRVRWEITKAEVERDLANIEEACWQELKKTAQEVKAETPQIEMFDEEIEKELAETDEDLAKFKEVNLLAEEEFVGQKQRYDFLIQQRSDLRASISSTREAMEKIDEESRTQFMAALEEVRKNFQDIFALLFKGGVADIRLTDSDNPLESGIDIIAQPPGKKVQNITLLSGGEKSLTSLAFIFAMFRYKPSPFCILDEVDAALDENNLKRFLDMMKTIKSSTQFIVITHNYKTMEVADYIYGTTMDEPNVTKLYSVRLERKEEN